VLHGTLGEVRGSYGSLRYELRYVGDSEKFTAAATAANFTISESRQEAGLQVATVSATCEDNANLLLQHALKVVKVEYFARLEPSMHDVFIAAVTKEKNVDV
jgi:ABC-type uncharacterized transport system ATPase subunit